MLHYSNKNSNVLKEAQCTLFKLQMAIWPLHIKLVQEKVLKNNSIGAY